MYSNPISQQLNGGPQPLDLQPLKNIMRQIQNAPNAEQLLLNQFPGLQNVLNLARTRNVSLEQIARIMAQQKGRNIDDIIQELSAQ